MNAIIVKIKNTLEVLTTQQLKESIAQLKTNYDEGAGIVFSCALDVLETRVTEAEFVNFCEAI